MAVKIVNVQQAGPGKVAISVVGNTPDEAVSPEARQLVSERAVAELRVPNVFLREMQPAVQPLDPNLQPVQDVTITPSAYGAVYNVES